MTAVTTDEVADWEVLRDDWLRLEQCSQRITPFQKWDWAYNFWKLELQPHELHLLRFKADGKTVGIAPLYTRKRSASKRLGLIGGDYNDILAAQGFELEVLTALGEWLRLNMKRCGLADFRNLHRDALVLRLSGYPGVLSNRSVHQSYPTLDLPETWDGFTSALSKGLASELRYIPRKIEKDFGGCRVETPAEDSVFSAMDELFRLHQLRWQAKGRPGAFASQAVREMHQQVAAAFAETGGLILKLVKAGDKAIAAVYCLCAGSTATYYLGGFDPEYAKYSPSKLTIAECIREAIDRGYTTFDFLKGNEEYKSQWRAEPQPTYRLVLGPIKVSSALTIGVLKAQPRAKSFLRAWRRKLRGE